jgi:hypothetical protein
MPVIPCAVSSQTFSAKSGNGQVREDGTHDPQYAAGMNHAPIWLVGFSKICIPPPFPEYGRVRLVDFPIEKIIIARPRMDFRPANLAAETARMLVWMLLLCCGVRQPAIGAAKKFGRPNVACHPAFMRRAQHKFQCSRLPQSMTYYSNPRIF